MFKGIVTETEAVSAFNHRIIGMMADYQITMSEALYWDFEGFENSVKKLYQENGFETVEKHFEKYLRKNLIRSETNIAFYRDIFTGKSNDLALKNIEEMK